MQQEAKKPSIAATGGIHIGETFMKSFQASWPFGKLEVSEKEIVLRIQYLPSFVLKLFLLAGKFPEMIGSYKAIPTEIHLDYSKIKGYKERDAKFMGYGITIIHENSEYPPFLQFWTMSRGKAKKITDYLNSKGIFKAEQ